MIRKERSDREGYVRVTFELPASLWAGRVELVGDFNNWRIGALPLREGHDGVWRLTLELPAHRRYEFRYWIDGRWCSEYHADGNAGIYGLNSVLETTLPPECMADYVGHGMVHEALCEQGMNFPVKRHR